MRAFLTGGSGFMGRYLIAALRARGDSVRALARSATSLETVRAAGAEPVKGDLDDPEAMKAGMAGCDVVFHAAAHTVEWGPLEDFLRINVEGTQRVLDAARAAGVRRVVHIGTEAALLDGPPLVNVDESRPLPERAIGQYASTKNLAERRVLAASGQGLETVVVRPRLIWGVGDTNLVPKLVEAVKTGRWMWIGGGTALTSTCHVKNACHGALLAAEKGRSGEVYFVTDGAPVDYRSFLSALIRSGGVVPGERKLPLWAAKLGAAASEAAWRWMRLKGAPPVTRTAVLLMGQEVTVSDAKARRELGYAPIVSREEGLRELSQKAAHA